MAKHLSKQQLDNIARAQSVANRMGASPRERKALIEAMGVESNYQNLNYGDRDSVGILQQRPSQGWGPGTETIEQDVEQFLTRAKAANTGKGSAGQLAQAVQRSAFPERYDQRSAEADALMGSSAPTPESKRYGVTRTPGKFTPGTPETTTTDTNAALTDALLRGRGQGGLLKRALAGVQSGSYTTTTPGTESSYEPGSVTTPPVARQPKLKRDADARVDAIVQDANLIDKAKVPYEWGGGHAGKIPRGSDVTPLDCSGAVSRVLGIDPRVSGQLAEWGKPGKGSRVTIWANPEHVVLEVDGKIWGTSKSNPGGGAGWIETGFSTEYLAKNYTPRHPNGM